MRKISVGIVGIGGYTGLELLKLLLSHPVFEIAYLGNTKGECEVIELYPSLMKVFNQSVMPSDAKEIAKKCELVFLALPHQSAMEFAKELLNFGIKIIDLSADYRLSLENYEAHYCLHTDPTNLKNAVYGLPEYNAEKIKDSFLVANPGCYPTATLLALLPFVPYLQKESIFVDAKSGVSGAGKTPNQKTHFCTINENVLAYSPLEHRHQIEIQEKIQEFQNAYFQVNFIPHLLPLTRGMLVSVYAKLEKEIDPLDILNQAYANAPFIRIRTQPVEVKQTSGTHFCDIYAKRVGKDLWINSAIDNLLRGASSQALYNANLMFHLPQDLGIPKIAYVP